MTMRLHFHAATCLLTILLAGGCAPDDGGTPAANGKSTGGASTTGVGATGASTTTAGGTTSGATSSGGATTTGNATATGGSTAGGSVTSTSGATTGVGTTAGASTTTGGSVTASGGSATTSGATATSGTTTSGAGTTTSGSSTGASATGNSGRDGGATTAGGTTGGGGTGDAGVAAPGAGDAFVSGVTVAVSKLVNTILVVTWTQAKAADQTWLEFSFAGSSVMTSHPLAGATGAHRDVVLGVPGSTAVTVRIVSKLSGVENKTKDYMGTTGAVPAGLPKSTTMMYDATLASPDRWMLGAVENSTGGCTNDSCYFNGTWWLYVMDRQGRIVWYYADPSTNDVSSFPQKARDGEYLFVEKRAFSTTGVPSVLKMTLDRELYNQTVMVPLLSDAVDMTNDGLLLYDTEERARGNAELREMDKAGTVRIIWNCDKYFGAPFLCYSNTVNWNPATDTVLLSFPEMNTIAEIDRKTGTVVATYGSQSGSYSFSPTPWSFVWQHFPNITPQGTLLVSTHLPQFTKSSASGPNQHVFEEFDIDRTNKRLTRKWMYGDAATDGAEWALSRGMALRLANGNTLVNYGTGGVIREVTPDKKTVFYVKFDVTTGNDYFNKLVGHNFLINDLYTLNGGGPK